MDRKGIVAIVLAILVLVGWSQYYSRQMARYTEERRVEAEAAVLKNPAPAPATISGVNSLEAPKPAAPVDPAALPERIEQVTTPAVVYTFTNLGAGIARVALREHKAEQGSPVELNRFGKIPIGALSESPGENTTLAFQQTSPSGAQEVTYERTDPRQLHIVKKFTLPQAGAQQDEYAAQLTVTFTNRGTEALTLPAYYLYAGSAAPLHQSDLPNYTGAGWYHAGEFKFKDSGAFSAGGFIGFGKTDAPVYTETIPETEWAGVTSQYYSTIVTATSPKGSGVWARRFAIPKNQIGHIDTATNTPPPTSTTPAETLNAVEAALTLPGFTLAPGASAAHTFQVYAGPREYHRLGKLGPTQDAFMDFGMFRIISKSLLSSMNWLRAHLGSFALAIIVLTIIIRGLMWPLQNKATQSMKNIAALQPKMAELKERYPDDPARVQQETMKLYKQYNINPVMGCLPMLVQIPIFFGFYNMLGKAVELRNAPFLWVKDLSQPDTIAHVLGFPLNVLPLCMAVTMFWQMKISPKSGDAMQQRIFMFMPIIFIMFCYSYASALALYWTVQNLFSIAQLYVTRDKITPVLQKVPASSTKKRS